MKQRIKALIPDKLLSELNIRMGKRIFDSIWEPEKNRYLHYSNYLFKNNNKKKIIGSITTHYHIIEKGLTMPKMRKGFGQEVMELLMNECCEYHQKYEDKHPQFLHALGVIFEYLEIHKDTQDSLSPLITKNAEQLRQWYPDVNPIKQLQFNKDDFFEKCDSSFLEFAWSRHSVRNFVGSVKREQIENAITLAQSAPSACNRQTTQLYVILQQDTTQAILEIQRGNRGFGNQIEQLIVLTTESGVWGTPQEFTAGFTDGGIYAMNLLYALHYYKVGACPLNTYFTSEENTQIRKLLPIPDSERIVLIIACGELPEHFQCTQSKRNPQTLNTHWL